MNLQFQKKEGGEINGKETGEVQTALNELRIGGRDQSDDLEPCLVIISQAEIDQAK